MNGIYAYIERLYAAIYWLNTLEQNEENLYQIWEIKNQIAELEEQL